MAPDTSHDQRADTVRPEDVIIDALDLVLDWRSPPWNLAEDEAKRDYEHLAVTILKLLRSAGFVVATANDRYGVVALMRGDHSDGKDAPDGA